jgi:PAS domain S-box-containing protein
MNLQNKSKASKILVVEDNGIVSLNIKLALQKYEYDVGTAGTSEKAIHYVKEFNPDLVLMDIDLNEEIDGIETAKIIHEFSDVPIIFLTAFADITTIDRAKGENTYGYLIKPFESSELYSSIEIAINNHLTKRQIRESELKQKQMIANISDVIAVMGIDGIINYVSPNISKWFGWNPEDLVGSFGWKTAHPDDLERIQNDIYSLIKTYNSSTNGKYRYKCKDGRYKYIEFTAINLTGDAAIKGILMNFHDITAQMKAEETLRLSDQRYKGLIQNTRDGFLIVDMEGNIQEVNDSFCKMSGYTSLQLMKMNVREIDHLFSNEEINQKFEEIQINGSNRFESLYKCADGSLINVDISTVFLKEQYRFLLFINNTTIRKNSEKEYLETVLERKQFQQKLKESEDNFKIAFMISPDPICITRYSDGRYVFVNIAYTKINGYNEDDILGKTAEDLNIWVDKDDRNRWSRELYANNSVQNLETRYRAKNSTIIVGLTSSSIIELNSEKHILSITRDISERVKNEHELSVYRSSLEELVKVRTNELNKVNQSLRIEIVKEKEVEMMLQSSLEKEKELNAMKTRFISTASHEFRTPLANIQLSNGLLQRYAVKWPPEKLFEQYALIDKSIKNITNLLDKVLTLSRSESGKIQFAPEFIDLLKLCDTVIEETNLYKLEGHHFTFKYMPKSKVFFLDPDLIHYFLTNLLINAFKYSVNGGEISLTISYSRKKLNISVKDCGIGIPAKEIPFIFEPFHRCSNINNIPGSGLGLSIVHRTVEYHNGKIEVESIEDVGTTVNIIIPTIEEK